MNLKHIATAALFAAASAQASADVTVSAGVEHFTWKEYSPATGSQLLKEYGERLRVGLDIPITQAGDFAFGYQGNLYGGTVNYDGQTWGGTPVATDTGYLGISNEVSAVYSGVGGKIAPMMALGKDSWTRDLQTNASVLGYTEDYSAWYVRMGVVGAIDERFSWKAGVKLPFAVRETAYLSSVGFGGDVTLKPKGRTSLYASLSYAIDKNWSAQVAYEGTRFGQSDLVNASFSGIPVQVLQPRSSMDVFNVSIARRF